jgi:hypothetical protein
MTGFMFCVPAGASLTRKTSMTGLSLFQKNLQFLDVVMPELAARARAATDTLTRPVWDESGIAVDIDLGGGRLYNRPAAEFAQEQVASWLRMPNRVVVNRPDPDSLADISTQVLCTRLGEEVGADLCELPRMTDTGLLVIIGLGLGLHVPALLEHLSPRHVVLIEPMEEFAVHSLHAFDWASLVEGCTARGGTLDVIANFDPRAVKTELEALITRFGPSCVDGAYSFLHYQTDATRAIAQGFQELTGMKSTMQGYYADEKLMIENTIANVSGDEFWMVDGAYQALHGLPAFIVGSGPSLDGALEAIREWQGHAVIFSAGSALESLLAAGITPDFHVEKENNSKTEARIAHIFEQSGGGGETFGTSLIASTTVKPSVLARFDDKFLFLRQELSSTRMFGAGFEPVVGTGPFSANTAIAAATTLGFRNVYLFGCDCGSVDPSQHHAQNTAYHTRDGHTSNHAKMPLRVPANFGGEAWSNAYFLWSRWVFESLITQAEIKAFNCSDGIAIAGATPLRPKNLTVSGQKIDKARLLETFKGHCLYQAPGTYFDSQDVDGVLADWHGFRCDVLAFLDDTLAGVRDLEALDDALTGFIDICDQTYGGVVVPLRGSMLSMLPVAGYFVKRAPDDDIRARLMNVFRDVYRTQVVRMLDDATAMLEAIAADHGAPVELEATG